MLTPYSLINTFKFISVFITLGGKLLISEYWILVSVVRKKEPWHNNNFLIWKYKQPIQKQIAITLWGTLRLVLTILAFLNNQG